jgi:phosphoribosylformylglycinamidine cyclo-ligase
METEMKEFTGVDLALGTACSQIAYQWAKRTRLATAADRAPSSEHSKAPFAELISIAGVKLAMTSDGIGTKIEVAERIGVYQTLGCDLVAMVADDLVCCGARPTHLSNILDVNRLNCEVVDALMKGLSRAAREADMIVTGGEIAELGMRIGGYGLKMRFNWCATALGPVGDWGVIDGSAIQPGDLILSLKSAGFRSNGFSLARRILEQIEGARWHHRLARSGRRWGDALLEPSIIYTPAIIALLEEGIAIRGIAHITGGGIPGNLSRVLGKYGARLHSLFPPTAEMQQLVELGDIPISEAYSQSSHFQSPPS